ncbi:MAG: thioredoxin [Gemmatimonadetes bacterium]|nr:MAG: thioredoxin [Gemmatimonadota bacterium]
MAKLNTDNFEAIIINAGKPAVLDFGAGWCAPCKKIEPILEELSEEYGDQAVFGKVDIDNYPDIAAQFNVMSVPTVIFLKNGEEQDRIIGLEKKPKIVKRLEAILG